MQIEKALMGIEIEPNCLQFNTVHFKYKQIILTSKTSGVFENQLYEILQSAL